MLRVSLVTGSAYPPLMHADTTFLLNGQPVDLAAAEPTQSLLRWLRGRHLTGTKEGCGDGDCGACTVVLIEADKNGESHYVAVNSCLLPVGLLPGRELLTVEALADGETLHPAQQALVDHHGSQCGYCTPGFVMSLFAGFHEGELNDHTTEGNLCRCTGYRPIRDATAALRQHPASHAGFEALLATPRVKLAGSIGNFHSPTTLEDAVALKQRYPEACFFAGGTDLGVNLSRHQDLGSVFIALDRIAELQRLDCGDKQVQIGAGVSLTRIEKELTGVFPALDEIMPWFAARQIRNRATFGGSLGSASPIGDLAPFLLALDATVECFGPVGRREIAMADFFLDYRKTARSPDEIITAVLIPLKNGVQQGFYKLAKRQTDDISIVAAAFAIERDEAGVVRHARLAYGGVASTPIRALAVEAMLQGHRLDAALVEAARAALTQTFSPLSDHRASADYRRVLCGNLFAKFMREKLGVEGVA